MCGDSTAVIDTAVEDDTAAHHAAVAVIYDSPPLGACACGSTQQQGAVDPGKRENVCAKNGANTVGPAVQQVLTAV